MNYIEVKNKVPFRSSFMYIDRIDYVSDQIFIDHELRGIRFGKKELHNKEYGFTIILCHIFTKDKEKFYNCMEILKNRLRFLGCDMDAYEYLCDVFELAKSITEKEEEDNYGEE